MRRPSDPLPAGMLKNVSPYGGGMGPKAAENPPVSEFESPRLNMAGKLHGEDETDRSRSDTSVRTWRGSRKRRSFMMCIYHKSWRFMFVMKMNDHQFKELSPELIRGSQPNDCSTWTNSEANVNSMEEEFYGRTGGALHQFKRLFSYFLFFCYFIYLFI